MPGGQRNINDEQITNNPNASGAPVKVHYRPGEPLFPTDENGEIISGNYATSAGEVKIKKIERAKAYDVINVARAMNPDDFAPRVQELFQPEVEACKEAFRTGVYISYRPIDHAYSQQDCIRINATARCFCSHQLTQHEPYTGQKPRIKCLQAGCKCPCFLWVPSRPEESGEFWLPRRRGYDPTAYRAKCRCKHTHEEHEAYPSPHRCLKKGCGCQMFYSAFVCAACDKHWHQHRTIFELESDRVRDGRQVGKEWFPFSELPDLAEIAITGVDNPSVQVLADALPQHVRERMILDQQNNRGGLTSSNSPAMRPSNSRGGLLNAPSGNVDQMNLPPYNSKVLKDNHNNRFM